MPTGTLIRCTSTPTRPPTLARSITTVTPTVVVQHRHVHRHVAVVPHDPFMRYHGWSSFGVGLLHGVGAETPTQVVVFAAAANASGRPASIALLLCFVVGLLVSNSVVAAASTFGFARVVGNRLGHRHARRRHRGLQLGRGNAAPARRRGRPPGDARGFVRPLRSTVVGVTISIAEPEDAVALTEALVGLVPQLSRSNPPPSLEAVRAMLAHEAIVQFVATDDAGAIVGVSTLVVFPIPTTRRAWIEDVIVDSSRNGQGIGRQLIDAMVAQARELGCKTVDLTSRPSREAANHLYQSAGFERRETNVWRFTV